MPRPVVPIFAAPAASSRIRSRSWCRGRISGVFSAIIRFVGRDRHPLPAQLLDLGQQRPGVEHHAVADDAELAGPHDPRGQQRQLVDLAVDHQRVAGVVAALEAGDHVGPLAQPVDDLALALVAPLRADDHHVAPWSRPFARSCEAGLYRPGGGAETAKAWASRFGARGVHAWPCRRFTVKWGKTR